MIPRLEEFRVREFRVKPTFSRPSGQAQKATCACAGIRPDPRTC